MSEIVLRAVTPTASVMLAPNPSPMTLEGTNTWLLRGGEEEQGYIVIDAGPPDDDRQNRALFVWHEQQGE